MSVRCPLVLLLAAMISPLAPAQICGAPPDQSHTTESRLFDSRSLDGWEIADDGVFSGHGTVTVREGAIQLEAGDPATGVALKAQPPLVNYELSLMAKRTSGGDFFCGLTFPVGKQYCTLIVGGWGGDVLGLSNVDGSSANENQTSTFRSFDSDRWYRIRLRVTEKNISAWIDKEQVINLDTKGHEFDIWVQQQPMRPLGIATWYTGAALKDITLQTVPSPEGKLTAGQDTACDSHNRDVRRRGHFHHSSRRARAGS